MFSNVILLVTYGPLPTQRSLFMFAYRKYLFVLSVLVVLCPQCPLETDTARLLKTKMAERNLRVCVIGAGIVGSSTALCLLEERPNIDLTVYSDREFEYTTNYRPNYRPLGLHRLIYPELKSYISFMIDIWGYYGVQL